MFNHLIKFVQSTFPTQERGINPHDVGAAVRPPCVTMDLVKPKFDGWLDVAMQCASDAGRRPDAYHINDDGECNYDVYLVSALRKEFLTREIPTTEDEIQFIVRESQGSADVCSQIAHRCHKLQQARQ
jgi:hypothetical protein